MWLRRRFLKSPKQLSQHIFIIIITENVMWSSIRRPQMATRISATNAIAGNVCIGSVSLNILTRVQRRSAHVRLSWMSPQLACTSCIYIYVLFLFFVAKRFWRSRSHAVCVPPRHVTTMATGCALHMLQNQCVPLISFNMKLASIPTATAHSISMIQLLRKGPLFHFWFNWGSRRSLHEV